jgi:hypothetical protein
MAYMHVHIVWTMKVLMPPEDHTTNGNDGVYELIIYIIASIRSVLA